MSMKKRSFLFTGIPSVFLIFSLLALSILSLMSLSVSRSDLAISQASLQQTEGYLAACSQATDLLSSLREALKDTPADSRQLPALLQKLSEKSSAVDGALPVRAEWEEGSEEVCFYLAYTDKLSLVVRAKLSSGKPEVLSSLSLTGWQSQYTGDWLPDTHQNVYLPEE